MIKIGSTVKLKSGGPLMTVISVVDDRAWCMWFADEKFDVAGADFHIQSLVEMSDELQDEITKVYHIVKAAYQEQVGEGKINLLSWLIIRVKKGQ